MSSATGAPRKWESARVDGRRFWALSVGTQDRGLAVRITAANGGVWAAAHPSVELGTSDPARGGMRGLAITNWRRDCLRDSRGWEESQSRDSKGRHLVRASYWGFSKPTGGRAAAKPATSLPFLGRLQPAPSAAAPVSPPGLSELAEPPPACPPPFAHIFAHRGAGLPGFFFRIVNLEMNWKLPELVSLLVQWAGGLLLATTEAVLWKMSPPLFTQSLRC